jgi:hypothetical protein
VIPKAKFKLGQVVHVDGNFDYIIKRTYSADRVGDWDTGWWYNLNYPGDCETFHECLLRALTKKEKG